MKTTDGYLQVGLMKDGRQYRRRVNRLVAAAFIGPIPDGMDVCHNDGTRDNNTLDNLRIDTKSSNQADRKLHGTWQGGERNGQAKLTESDVLEIRSLYKGKGNGPTQRELAEKFGIAQQGVSRIINRNYWTHV